MARVTAFIVAMFLMNHQALSKTKIFCSHVKSNNANKINLTYPEYTHITDILDAFAAMYQINLVYDRNLNGKIKLFTFSRKNDRQNCEILLAALNQLHLTLVDDNDVYKIMPIRTALKNRLPYLSDNEKTPATHQRFRRLIKIRHQDARWMRSSLAKIFSPNSLLLVEQSSSIIISESGYRIQEFERLVKRLDKPCDKKCKEAKKRYLERLERKTTNKKSSAKKKLKKPKTPVTQTIEKIRPQETQGKTSLEAVQSVTLSKSETLESLGEGYARILNVARLVPYMNNNKVDGFKIFAIKPDSIIAKMSLKNGDILQKINNHSLAAEDGYLLFMSLEKGEDFTIDLLRQGKEIQLKVLFKD